MRKVDDVILPHKQLRCTLTFIEGNEIADSIKILIYPKDIDTCYFILHYSKHLIYHHRDPVRIRVMGIEAREESLFSSSTGRGWPTSGNDHH